MNIKREEVTTSDGKSLPISCGCRTSSLGGRLKGGVASKTLVFLTGPIEPEDIRLLLRLIRRSSISAASSWRDELPTSSRDCLQTPNALSDSREQTYYADTVSIDIFHVYSSLINYIDNSQYSPSIWR